MITFETALKHRGIGGVQNLLQNIELTLNLKLKILINFNSDFKLNRLNYFIKHYLDKI